MACLVIITTRILFLLNILESSIMVATLQGTQAQPGSSRALFQKERVNIFHPGMFEMKSFKLHKVTGEVH